MFRTLISGRIRRQLLAAITGLASAFILTGWTAPASAAESAASSPAPLKIGIIGTGKIGSALARHWAKAGHELVLSSRNPEQLQSLAAELGPNVRTGTPQEAASFGEVVLVSVPYAALPQVGKDYGKQLAGKIIIDTCNPFERRDGAMAIEALSKGAGVATAEFLNNKRVVRAFSAIHVSMIASDAFRQPVRRAIPIGGDDAEALAVTSRLVSEAGFDPVVIGSLASTRAFDLGQPLANKDWTAAKLKAELAK